jgi:hypothetical protein
MNNSTISIPSRLFSKEKFVAAAWHLAISSVFAIFVLLAVYFFWYPSVLSYTQAIGSILFIVLAVDVVLGPCLTFLIFKSGKKSLRFDLACIASAQIIFLGFGLDTVYSARPAFLVFTLDRFEVVSTLDWIPEHASKASAYAKPNFFRPKIVGAKLPADPLEKKAILETALIGGADLAQIPKHYVNYEDVTQAVSKRAKPLAELKLLNSKKIDVVNSIPSKFGLPEKQLGYIPLRGKINDAVVIVDIQSANVMGYVALKPWP